MILSVVLQGIKGTILNGVIYKTPHSFTVSLKLRFSYVCYNSQTYLREFLEVGGVQTLLQLISVKQAKEEDKTTSINVLYSVADSGRKYKEHICECYGTMQSRSAGSF